MLHEVAAIKDRIEKEIVGAEELERNVKLGRGGIREIEFVAQSLQILHAGSCRFCKPRKPSRASPNWRNTICSRKRKRSNSTPPTGFSAMSSIACKWRTTSRRTRFPPTARRNCGWRGLMGFKSLAEFETALQMHTGNVRRVYDQLLKADAPKSAHAVLPPEFDGAEAEWENLLAAHSFRDPETAFRLLKEFAEGPGYVHVSPHTTELARQLILKFLALCPQKKSTVQSSKVDSRQSAIRNPILSDPDRVVTRLDSFIEAYGTRAALFEMWNGNPAAFELLLLLFDRSEFLAEAAIRTPDLIDDLVAGGRLRQRKTAPEILKDLRHGLDDEDQFLWLRRYHEAELMRLGLRDILGLADFEQNLAELSALADACLQYALEVVMRKNKIKTPPFVIIGLGKLGGCEIDYGSDLDILFVTDAPAKDLPKLQRLAVEVMELLSRRTEQGMVFHTDARLRPDGEKGLLVNTLAAYEELLPAAGAALGNPGAHPHAARGRQFGAGRKISETGGDIDGFSERSSTSLGKSPFSSPGVIKRRDSASALQRCPPCFTPDWKKQIHQMRLRIEKERTPRGQDDLAIKTGKGGLMDAEFIAQALCLENGWQEANTLRALERAREAGASAGRGKVAWTITANCAASRAFCAAGVTRAKLFCRTTRRRIIAFPCVVVSATPGGFGKALAKWRQAIREVYEKVFNRRDTKR